MDLRVTVGRLELLDMKLTYCEKCGALITELAPAAGRSQAPVMCPDCAEGKKPPKRRAKSRDSGQIPVSKLRKALEQR